MRRVGIVCGAGIVSGKEIMTLELAEGLRARGYPLEIVTSLWGSEDFAGRLGASGFPVHQLWLGFISATLRLDCLCMTADQMRRWPQLLAGYRRFLRAAAPERIIHTNWQHLLLLWPFLKPERDLFWLHEVVPNKSQYRRVFGGLVRRLQCFVPVSQAVARSLTDIGIPQDKIHVIYNGLKDPVPFRESPPHPSLSPAPSGGEGGRRPGEGEIQENEPTMPKPPEGGTPIEKKHDRLRIGIVGQVGAWKGHEDLLEAFALVAQSHPTAEMHVFGRGNDGYKLQLKHRAESLGISGRITWHGFVANRASIFQSIDICVFPSRCEESFGLVAAEAGFFGLPVVASRLGGLAEIVEHGVTGFLVEAAQPTELAARLDELLKNDELRIRMGEAARRRVEAHFSHEGFVEKFTQLLEGNLQ